MVYLERDWSPKNERQVHIAVSGREATEERDVVILEIMVHQLVDTFIAQFRSTVGKVAKDDTPTVAHNTAFEQSVEYAVDMMKIFANFLDKEDEIFLLSNIAACADKCSETEKVATDEDALSAAADVVGIMSSVIGGQRAEKQVAEQGCRHTFAIAIGYARGHNAVDGSLADGCRHSQERGDIAITHNPFGVLRKERSVELIDKTDTTIASPVADDSLDGRIGESPLEVAEPLPVGTGKLIVASTDIGGDNRRQSPGLKDLGSSTDLLDITIIRRRNQSHRIANSKEWRKAVNGAPTGGFRIFSLCDTRRGLDQHLVGEDPRRFTRRPMPFGDAGRRRGHDAQIVSLRRLRQVGIESLDHRRGQYLRVFRLVAADELPA